MLWQSRRNCKLVQVVFTEQTAGIKSPNGTQNFLTKWGTLPHRIPQGPILEPSWFITFINDHLLRISPYMNPYLLMMPVS
jgi:hypothetical protein